MQYEDLLGLIAIYNECTKVPGTLARTYANKHVCIFN